MFLPTELLGQGCLGRAGWGRACCWCFPTHSPSWGPLGTVFPGCPSAGLWHWLTTPQDLGPLSLSPVGFGGCASPALVQPFAELSQGKALEQSFYTPDLEKLCLTQELPGGVSLNKSALLGLFRMRVQDSPRGAAGPPLVATLVLLPATCALLPTGSGAEAASTPLSCRAKARGCGMGAVQAVQPVTSPWSYRSLVSPVFLSVGCGPALPVGYCGYGLGERGAVTAFLPLALLRQLSACSPAVSQPPLAGHGGPSQAEEQPLHDQKLLWACSQALSQLPCTPNLTLYLGFPIRGSILPQSHLAFDSSHACEG